MTAKVLVVMLPGAGFGPSDFAERGFVSDLDRWGGRVRGVVANIPETRYLDGDIAPWLHETCIAPARREGTERLWLLGISLGGMGALMSLRAGLAQVEGLMLLSPFLATRGSIASVVRAGGLKEWTPPPVGPADVEIGFLTWLKSSPLIPIPVHLGCGLDDRYVPASQLLAAQLPPSRTYFTQGGHDWLTWSRLWRSMLDSNPFGQ